MKTLFAKYNRERLPQFQTVTKIVKLANGQQKAIKQALMPEAQQHIAEIYANYARLTTKYPQIKLVLPTLEDANTVTFPMADGISLENLLKQALDKQDKDAFFALLDKFIAYVDSFVTERQVKFVPCEKFKQVFGEWTLDEPQDLIELANVDMIFGNLFVANDGSITQIDYEWVFDFKIPKKYILWRAIFVLYWMNQKNHANLLILKNLLDYVGIEFIDHEFYCAIDYSFQKFVHGVETKYFLNYRVKQPQIEPIDTRITKYPENSHIQLFYYQNDEINVPDVRTQYFADENQTKFSFDLAHLANLTHIRIDLTNFPVMANLEYVKVIMADGSEHVVQACYSNANLIEGNSYTYLHNDPINVYYLTPLNLAQIVRVEIAVDLQPIKRSEVFELANQITAKQNEKLVDLSHYKQLAHNLNPWNNAQVCLHYDTGNDFNGTEFLLQPAHDGVNTCEFDLNGIANLKGLRLDPVNLPARVKLLSAQLVANDGTSYDLPIKWHNANNINQDEFGFYHDDPIIIFDLTNLNLTNYSKLSCEFQLSLVNVHELSSFIINQLAQLSEQAIELQNTESKLINVTNELTAVYQSQSWKITKPLRKFCKLFKG